MTILIAEVKTKSPYGFKSEKSWEELFELAQEIGDWVAIHTDPRWDGSYDLLYHSVRKSRKPIIAKGIHASENDVIQAFLAGATYVLVVGRNLPIREVHDHILYEPLSLTQMMQYPSDSLVVWNQRNLESGEPKTVSFPEARNVWPGWLCQASFIEGPSDVYPNADAVLVGEHLFDYACSRLNVPVS